MKLILIALIPLIVVSLVSMAGLGSTDYGTMNAANIGSQSILYDDSGHAVVYANGTEIGETGAIREVEGASGLAFWQNSTGTYPLNYDAAATQPAKISETAGALGGGSWTWTGQLTGSLGLMVLIAGLMALVAIVGARFLTYGQSEIGVDAIYKGSAYSIIWGVFSLPAFALMTSHWALSTGYFILTVIYTLGVVNSVGHPSGDF